MFERMIRNSGRPFSIIREGNTVVEADGYKNAKERMIAFRPDVNVHPGDWIVDHQFNARFYVSECDPLQDVGGRTIGIKAFYETERTFLKNEADTQLIQALDDIAESIWTLSDEKMPPEKKKRARAALTELKDVLKTMPQGATSGIAEQFASRLLGS